MVVRQ